MQAIGLDDPRGSTRLVAAAESSSTDTIARAFETTPAVAVTHSGHGNVMPASIHGGPGRAGGGEVLGGLRALRFYHRRTSIQAETQVLARLEVAGSVSL